MSSLLRFRFATIAAAVAVAASLASVGYVSADVVLPTGLPAGSQYRLVFITADSRDATSTDIADYNAFVTQEAQQSSSPFVRSLTWTAIASTQAVAAFDNANLGAAVAVYNTNGQMVVPGTQASPLLTIVHSSPIIWDQDGTANNDPLLSPWTGSTYAGEPTFPGYPNYHFGLGTSTPIYGAAASLALGGLNNYSASWLEGGAGDAASSEMMPLYAISNVITVAPEPGTLVLVGGALAGFGAFAAARRRWRRT